MRRTAVLYAAVCLSLSIACLNGQPAPSSIEYFEAKVRPVLAVKCYPCHSDKSGRAQGGLWLDSAQGIKQGGNSGPLIDTSDPERSLLLRAIRYQDKDLKMPPGKALPAETVSEIEAWVRAGAALPSDRVVAKPSSQKTFWSFESPKPPSIPAVRNHLWARNDIDRFILAKLEEKGLRPSAVADRRTLIRRVTYDLIGLPPTKQELDAFVADPSAQAYERLVDRLLASPHYGERWGRHWLDVARYSDARNVGDRFAWSYTYRDWVIRSLNEDLPYDQFLMQQIAADRIPGNDKRHLSALGYLSLGREFPKSFPETVDDRIDTVTRGMLGLTVACARCHDHKYDPIPTKDYYSLYSVFSNIREPLDFPVVAATTAVSEKREMYEDMLTRIRQSDRDYRQKRNAEMIAFFKTQIADYLIASHDASTRSNTDIEELVRERQLNLHMLGRWRSYLRESKASGDPVFRLWHAAAALPSESFEKQWTAVMNRTEGSNSLVTSELRAARVTSLKDVAEHYAALLAKYDSAEAKSVKEEEALRLAVRGDRAPVNVPLTEFELIYTEGDGNNTRAIRGRYNTVLAMYAYDGATPRAMAVEDIPNPKPAHVFLRGNPNNPGVETPGRFITCLSKGEPQVFQDGSGRLDLARAIASRDNPLTARVAVNRVWMHHFGSGLVRTPSDFGLRGEAPTHPELLDHLAISFMDSGWSMKKLHRAIVLSATYQQASSDNPEARKIDPENQWLWRMNRRRLDFESLRDSMLAVAGRLDLRIGGVPYWLTSEPSVPRRTVYGFVERGRIPGMLSYFDFPSPDQHAPTRFTTTVPQQALFLLNSAFVAEQSKTLANHVASSDPTKRITELYERILARRPAQDEVAAGLRFIGDTSAAPSATAADPDVWTYGAGELNPSSGQVTSFKHFKYFTGDAWQGASMLPDPTSGKARLTPRGGEPGDTQRDAVIRRWTSPIDGQVTIEGTIRHTQRTPKAGDGVFARIISSRLGGLASWSVDGRSAETRITGIEVSKGDVIDFVVDGRKDSEADDFTWAPVIKSSDPKGPTWSATADFRGYPPQRLNKWEQYAQVLLQTNEFAFVD